MGERRDPSRARLLWAIAAKALAMVLVLADSAGCVDRCWISPLEVPLWIASAGLDFDRAVRRADLGYDDLPVAARVSSREARAKRWVRLERPECAQPALADELRATHAGGKRSCSRRAEVCMACLLQRFASAISFASRQLVQPSATRLPAARFVRPRDSLVDATVDWLAQPSFSSR